MSQHDFNLANASGPAFRADANNAFLAAITLSAGATPPSPSFPNQWWFDASTGYIRKRDDANTVWVPVFALDNSGQFLFRPGSNDRNVIGLRNAANSTVVVLRVTDGGTGKIQVEDASSVTRAVLTGSNSGQLFLGGDETTGIEVHPLRSPVVATLSGANWSVDDLRTDARRVTINIKDATMSASAKLVLAIGTSGGLASSGYGGRRVFSDGSSTVEAVQAVTNIFELTDDVSAVFAGTIVLTQVIPGSTQVWSCHLVSGRGGAYRRYWGDVTISGSLTQFRFEPAGSPTFTGGQGSYLVE